MVAFLENAEGFVIFVFVKASAFVKAFGGELVVDFARRTKVGCQDSDDADDNEDKKSKPFE